jgi:hypothetical protein
MRASEFHRPGIEAVMETTRLTAPLFVHYGLIIEARRGIGMLLAPTNYRVWRSTASFMRGWESPVRFR